MTKKDWQRHLAYEALVILGVLALLLFVCRLWPILLLAMLGILAATLRLLFLSSPRVRPLEPMPPGAHKPPAKTPEETQVSQTFGNLQVQITRQVREEYPNARWVWKTPQATAAEEDLRGIQQEYRRKGVLFLAAAIGDDKENIQRIYGDAFLDISDLHQLPVKLAQAVKRFLRV